MPGPFQPPSYQQAPGPGPVPSYEPVPSPEETKATNINQRANEILGRYGVRTSDDPMNTDEVLQLWDRMGVDTQNQNVIAVAQQIAGLSTLSAQQQRMNTTQPFLKEFLKPVVPYQALLQSIGGMPTAAFAPAPGVSQLYAHDQEMIGRVPPSADSVDLADKGVIVWKNGVIVNYAPTTEGMPTGVVYDQGDASQAGSYAWQRNAMANWSASQVQNWRSKLYKAGYVTEKKGGWTQDLIQGTTNYYETKYTYGTEVAEAGTGQTAAQAAGALSRADVAKLVEKNIPTIHSTITDQYLSVFNEAPTADELHSWTAFITRTATELATGKISQRLTPDQAISQAQASMASKIFHSPQGQITFEATKENTSLHDGLTNAITATRGLA